MSAPKVLVIVESPTKAKTIGKFLPSNFIVESSLGHVRDLPQSAAEVPAKYKDEAWARMGVDIDNDFSPLYVVPKGKNKIIRELKAKLKGVDELYLATDEDREGESISWHLIQLLEPKIPIKRMVFHEITKSAIKTAVDECRDIDQRLVQAQETRRILDRLVGYTMSPLIWKKIAFGLSAGRVQSAGLRLLVERERERLHFKKASYWDIVAQLEHKGLPFDAKLTSVGGKRVASGKDFDETTGEPKKATDVIVVDETHAKALLEKVQSSPWKVTSVEEKPGTSRPTAPYITSTLQQDSNRKLGLSARDTMRNAQSLYEQGLITYMRTDSPNLSQQALTGARKAVELLFGAEYLSPEPRQFASKSKSAQEAHEAIRPAGDAFTPPKNTGLSGKELALYTLIWKRTLASQMADSKRLSMNVKLEAGGIIFSANGMKITFPGFLRVWAEGAHSPSDVLADKEVLLPDLKEGDTPKLKEAKPLAHETKPPARFNEASIVQRLEKEGIGRPSTYASIIATILARDYARRNGNSLVPTFTGIAVVQLLEEHFHDLVDYSFTSSMERSLDEIAQGDREWLPYLKEFYLGKHGLRTQVEEKEKGIDVDTSRTVRLLELEAGTQIRIGRFGPYVVKKGKGTEEVHASIPEDVAPADLSHEILDEIIENSEKGPSSIGKHPDTGEDIYVMLGRYGPYVQLGEMVEGKDKPRRASVPKTMDYKSLELDQAVMLLSLPRELGKHPTTDKPIVANNGRFGPYVVHDGDFRSLKKDDNVYEVTLERALEIISQEKRGRGGAKLLKDLGMHPDHQKKIYLYEGKYGPFIKFRTHNVSIPKEIEKPEEVTLEQAVTLVDGKIGAKKAPAKKAAKKSAKKAKKAGKKTKSTKAAKSSVTSETQEQKSASAD